MLREQPLRRAPMSLETRVLGEIARRQALPWWHKSYAYWPQPVRLAFVLVSVAMLVIGVLGYIQVFGGASIESLAPLVQPVSAAVATLRAAGNALWELVRPLAPSISTQWLYIAVAVIGASYAMLVGVGATAYRFLWSHDR